MTVVSLCFTCSLAALDYFDPTSHLESTFVYLLSIHCLLAIVFHEWPSSLSHFFRLVLCLFLPLNGDSSFPLPLYTPPKKSLFPWLQPPDSQESLSNPWLCADQHLEPDPHCYFFTETVSCSLPHFMQSGSYLPLKFQCRFFFLEKDLEDS